MNGRISISIIVPVYNPPIKYFKQFFDSVTNQTLDSIEIIFIDDNSNEVTKDCLSAFKRKDKRVRLIENKKNLRAGLSRQKGLKSALGEYILFADCDDLLSIETCEVLYGKAKQNDVDIVYSSYEIYDPQADKMRLCLFEDYLYNMRNSRDVYRAFLANNHALWNKLFRKELICNLKFPELKVNIGEDRVFNIQAFTNASKIEQTRFVSYRYILHTTSATNKNSKGISYLEVFRKSENMVTKTISDSTFKFLNKFDLGRRYSTIYFFGLEWIKQEHQVSSRQNMMNYWNLFLKQDVIPNLEGMNKLILKFALKFNLDVKNTRFVFLLRNLVFLSNKLNIKLSLIKMSNATVQKGI